MADKIIRCCDLVMKGGITSGVLYPPAIQEIAKRFFLVGIGGTSAGAIAACAAAAAEYRRRCTGSSEGYATLEKVSDSLSKKGKLKSLFRVDHTTEFAFDDILKLLQLEAGFLTNAKLFFNKKKIAERLRDNGFGLCSGLANGNSVEGSPALTEWLAATIDEVAGKTDGPLTFRDLHNAPIPEAIESKMCGIEDRSIDLRLVTTSLTFGRPLEFPTTENIFAFDPEEWASYFPRRIIAHLKNASNLLPKDSEYLQKLNSGGKLLLPLDDLPIIVAARMSLSFPVLFTMIPLWCVNEDEDGEPLRRVWFSDGGITSNFPIHRFDAIYPRWPTLGINLQYTEKVETVQRRRLRTSRQMIFLPRSRKEARLLPWNHFDSRGNAIDQLKAFAGAILSSARGWHDNAYLRLPSFQDRVAEIWLTEEEGGLNLDMEEDVVRKLLDRGREAGRLLAERFSDLPPDNEMSWDAHRWTRFRSGMAGLMKCLLEMKHAAVDDEEGQKMLAYFFESNNSPPCFKFTSDGQRLAAQQLTLNLLKFIRDTTLGDEDRINRAKLTDLPFADGPKPPVELGTRAPI